MRIILIAFLFVALLGGKSCKKEKISMVVGSKPVKMKYIISNLLQKCNYSIFFKDTNSKNILDEDIRFINVKNRSILKFIKDIITRQNYFCEIDEKNHLLTVSKKRAKSYLIDYLSFSKIVSKSNKISNLSIKNNSKKNNKIETVSKNEFWKNIKKELSLLLLFSDGKDSINNILINKEAGIVTIFASYNAHKNISLYLKKLLQRLNQRVLIEVKIVELIYNESNSSGVDWSNFSLGLKTTDVINANGYILDNRLKASGLFDFLNKYGKTKLISNPKILTINNQPAIINIGEELNYQYKDGIITIVNSSDKNTVKNSTKSGQTFVGISLDIIPEISKDRYVMIKLNANIRQKTKEHTKDGIQYLAPDVSTKNISTIVRINNNSSLIIGGLISNNKKINKNHVKNANTLPLIGRFFSSKKIKQTKSEMIIIVKPTIMDYKEDL